MKAADRQRLTSALRDHVAKVADDLRTKMRTQGPIRERAKKLHVDEQVGEDFEVWTDLLARRAAVLWVLKSVYGRVLEDRGLLSPGRILDIEAQQLFERLAPNLGETAFLRWVYRDLASANGGLPELFSLQPAEIAEPSDALSRELLAYWRHRDPDTGEQWSFAEERFEGELMGDLYQELDPVVKDRFALCQTPDFVREFILDRTLTPAIETFGADEVRLLDPACGSGHFLIDGLKRLVAATSEQRPEWDREKLVNHCLNRVVGIDLNDYACALARARLVMTASELAGKSTLAEAARFHPHVYWADGLEQVERGEDVRGQQLHLFRETQEDPLLARLTRPEVRLQLQEVFTWKFTAIVANPPYIVESDDLKRSYHTEKIGRNRRFKSAFGQYHLSGLFVERCFQLAASRAYVGVILDNQFMKRRFGIPLIQDVLSHYNLTLVVDTSKCDIPHHGTPTVMLFATAEAPVKQAVRLVSALKMDELTDSRLAPGPVWASILKGYGNPRFNNEFISVSDRPREGLSSHPWSLSSNIAITLREYIEEQAKCEIGKLVEDIGRTTHSGADSFFYLDPDTASRIVPNGRSTALVRGEDVRDWSCEPVEECLFPYNLTALTADEPVGLLEELLYWKYKTTLRNRKDFGKTVEERGLKWFEHSMFFPDRFSSASRIVYAESSTHNHFAFMESGCMAVTKQSAPSLKLIEGTDDPLFSILGYLNSSLACFLLKQLSQPKTHASQKHHPDPARAVYGYTGAAVKALPLPDFGLLRNRMSDLAERIRRTTLFNNELLGQAHVDLVLESAMSAKEVLAAMHSRWDKFDRNREQLVAWQEEIDWLVYCSVGLAENHLLLKESEYHALSCPRGQRPFEHLEPRKSMVRRKGKTVPLEEAEVSSRALLPSYVERVWQSRISAISSSKKLQYLESRIFKRPWRDTDQNVAETVYRNQKDRSQVQRWVHRFLEELASRNVAAFTRSWLGSESCANTAFQIACEVLSGRPDFNSEALVRAFLEGESVPHHRFHAYTESGRAKRAAWEEAWILQRKEETGVDVGSIPVPPEYSQGSRGKSTDFLKTEYWKLRGKLDVPKERFIAFTEVPGRDDADTLYGWAGWTPIQRIRALVAIDEDLEDDGVPLADRIGVLDSAWRLLPDAEREDAAAANRLKAELQALVGQDGPSPEMLESWRERFPPPSGKHGRKKKQKK